MEREIREIFSVPEDKLFTIPNGVELNNLNIDFNEEQFRSNYAMPNEKIVFFLGRHVYEKGIQLLVEAAPDIVNSYSKVKFIIAGEGPMTNELKEKVKLLGLDHKFLFIGYIEELTKNKLLKCADAAVFPSLYEPFGIAALEAMAAGCPVVVSDVGGLSEIVKHEVNGLKAAVGSKDSLRDNIVRLLTDESFKEKMDENLIKETLSCYSWDKIAVKTLELYGKVMEEAEGTEYEAKLSKAKKSSTGARKKKIVDDENDKQKAETAVDTASKPKRTRKKNI
jgi:glycosyltransferase involved in cell wall biosynthesis